jgi:CRISPR-associated protein Cmr2
MNSNTAFDYFVSRNCQDVEILKSEKMYTSASSFDLFKSLFETSSACPLQLHPPFSIRIQFTIHLASPFISKDDDPLNDDKNMIKKEMIFKWPMITGSTWKGNLRWAAGKLLENEPSGRGKAENRLRIINLFGSETAAEEAWFDRLIPENEWDNFKDSPGVKDVRKGRLNFFPTFFEKISREVINPHDRETKAGTVPVTIESVPEGADGRFTLLYVPFDLMGRANEAIKAEAKADIDFIAKALKKLMLEYGIGAKKSSGFGLVKKGINGRIEIKGKEMKSFEGFDALKQKICEVFS